MHGSFTSNSKWLLVTKLVCKRGEDMRPNIWQLSVTGSGIVRYFSGVQGDTSRQGELFGAKNIFRLHEDTLATKLAVSSKDWIHKYVGWT